MKNWKFMKRMTSVDSAMELETIEKLEKEVEKLKTRLEDERQKLNDVTCKLL